MGAAWNRRSGRTSKWIRRKRRLAIYARDGHRCVYCGSGGEHLTLDHIIPRVLGGTNDNYNLVTACRACNSARQHTRLTGEMLRRARVASRKPVTRREAA